MRKILLLLTTLIPCMSFANDGIKIDYTDGVCQCFGAEHNSTTLNVHKPGAFWPLGNAGHYPTNEEWVIYDESFFESSADESRKDFERLVQVIKGSGHSSAINEYWDANFDQFIYLNTDYVKKVTRL